MLKGEHWAHQGDFLGDLLSREVPLDKANFQIQIVHYQQNCGSENFAERLGGDEPPGK